MFKILVVEADRQMRELLAQALACSGYQVFTAADEVEGLFQFGLEQPDLVILKASYYHALVQLRALSSVPIIALAEDDSDFGVESLDLGADFYVGRPPRIGELQAKIRASARRLSTATRGSAPFDRSNFSD